MRCPWIHSNPDVGERDINRTFELEQLGIKVIRFRNEEVLSNVENVVRRIIEEAQ